MKSYKKGLGRAGSVWRASALRRQSVEKDAWVAPASFMAGMLFVLILEMIIRTLI